MRGPALNLRKPDIPLFAVTLALMGLGVAMVYSSSSVIASENFDSSEFFIKRQAVRFFLALGVLLLLRWVDYHALLRGGRMFLFLSLGLLAVSVVPTAGLSAGTVRGASRAIRVASLTLQPAEAVRLAFLIYLAGLLSRRQSESENFKRFLAPPLVILAVIVGLLLAQPDLGTAMATMAVVFVVLFVAGAQWKPLALVGLGGMAAGTLLAVLSPYRLERIMTFFAVLSGRADASDSGWHVTQSILSLGSGGLWGVGFGESLQKLFYLPEPYTDSIFCVIGEEFGFVGAGLVLVLYLVFVWRGIRVAMRAPDLSGMILAAGVTASVFVYFLINVAVTLSLVPATGLPLPFVSYGGSSLLFQAAGVGILLSISQQGGVPQSVSPWKARRARGRGARSRTRCAY